MSPTRFAPTPLAQLSDLSGIVETEDVEFVDVLVALGVVLVAILLAAVVGRAMRHWLSRPESGSEQIAALAVRLARWGIIVVGFAWALSFVGVSLGWFALTMVVVIAVVVLVLKPQLEGLATAVVLTTRPAFDVGDEIEVEDRTGEIVEITARSTVLRQRDGKRVHVPNQRLLEDVVTVISTEQPRRTEFNFEVPEGTDLDHLESVTLEAIDGVPQIVDDPPPKVLGRDLGQGALSVAVRLWHDSRIGDEVAATDGAIRSLARAYAAAGISTSTVSLAVSMRGAPDRDG